MNATWCTYISIFKYPAVLKACRKKFGAVKLGSLAMPRGNDGYFSRTLTNVKTSTANPFPNIRRQQVTSYAKYSSLANFAHVLNLKMKFGDVCKQ